MKTINTILAIICIFCLTNSCSDIKNNIDKPSEYRKITVVSDNITTRTDIEYELSDYSHLVWEEGDQVAFVTDVYDDLCSVAEVTDGSFEASIPSDASENNKLYVVYPADGLEGVNIDKIKMELPANQKQDTLSSLKGITIPMYAVTEIPDETSDVVKVRYNLPAATLRFSITSEKYPQERIQSVTLTSGSSLAGSMIISRPSNTIKLIKPVNEVSTEISNPSPISEGGYVYLNLMRGNYSDITVTVTTDKNTYSFENGTLDLTNTDYSLFKINLSLDGSTIVPQTKYFTEIDDTEVFSEDSMYLIGYKKSDSEYYIAGGSNGDYISSMPFEATEKGIEATEDVMLYAFTITPVSETEYYTLYSEAVSNSAPSAMKGKGYVGSPATTYLETGKFARGGEDELNDPEKQKRFYWTIGFEDGTPVITGALLNEYRFVYENWGAQFAPCKPSASSIRDIVILKLSE